MASQCFNCGRVGHRATQCLTPVMEVDIEEHLEVKGFRG